MQEKQIHAILSLSKEKSLSDAIIVESKGGGDINVDIDLSKVKKKINWSRIGSFSAVVIFVLSILIIKNPISANLLGKLSIWGLILIFFSNFLSNYIGTMWFVGRIGTNITRTSPEFLFKFVGWIILLIPVIYELGSRI